MGTNEWKSPVESGPYENDCVACPELSESADGVGPTFTYIYVYKYGS